MGPLKIEGHGHVTPRKDGALAKCGGPAICHQCAFEARVKELEDALRPMLTPCNRVRYGVCSTRACLVEGGYRGGPADPKLATCNSYRASVALRGE